VFVCSCIGSQGLNCQEFNVPSNIFALSSKIDEKFDGKNATFFLFLRFRKIDRVILTKYTHTLLTSLVR